MLATTGERVERRSAGTATERIALESGESVRHFAEHPDAIDQRLVELDREWDIDRSVETLAATLIVGGVLAGAILDRRYLLLSAAVAGFMLQHALRGPSAPVPFLRRAGMRTASEIERERYALKALRGDFDFVATRSEEDARANAAAALTAVSA